MEIVIVVALAVLSFLYLAHRLVRPPQIKDWRNYQSVLERVTYKEKKLGDKKD